TPRAASTQTQEVGQGVDVQEGGEEGDREESGGEDGGQEDRAEGGPEEGREEGIAGLPADGGPVPRRRSAPGKTSLARLHGPHTARLNARSRAGPVDVTPTCASSATASSGISSPKRPSQKTSSRRSSASRDRHRSLGGVSPSRAATRRSIDGSSRSSGSA